MKRAIVLGFCFVYRSIARAPHPVKCLIQSRGTAFISHMLCEFVLDTVHLITQDNFTANFLQPTDDLLCSFSLSLCCTFALGMSPKPINESAFLFPRSRSQRLLRVSKIRSGVNTVVLSEINQNFEYTEYILTVLFIKYIMYVYISFVLMFGHPTR